MNIYPSIHPVAIQRMCHGAYTRSDGKFRVNKGKSSPFSLCVPRSLYCVCCQIRRDDIHKHLFERHSTEGNSPANEGKSTFPCTHANTCITSLLYQMQTYGVHRRDATTFYNDTKKMFDANIVWIGPGPISE